jgi:hypothetical protein
MAFNETYPDAPITRYTSEARELWFIQNAPIIYNKFSPYTNDGIGPSSPLIYNKLTDTSDERNRIAFDTQETPLISTIVDVRRMGKMLRTATGINFLVNQNFIQSSNAFTETRVYNPLSVPTAASKTGAANRFGPTRHMETNGILSYAVSSLLSTIGLQTTQQGTNNPITGTATGEQGGKPYSTYAGLLGGARAGLLRFPTANNASVRSDVIWANGSIGGGGFLSNLGRALLRGITANIPSTNPMGAFGGEVTNKWKYRPEYKDSDNYTGMFEKMRSDRANLLGTTTNKASSQFYNGINSATVSRNPTAVVAAGYHKYYPIRNGQYQYWYASANKVKEENLRGRGGIGASVNITEDGGDVQLNVATTTSLKNVFDVYTSTIENFDPNRDIQFRRSTEAYSTVNDTMNPSIKFPAYSVGTPVKFSSSGSNVANSIENKNWFAKAKGKGDTAREDKYNALGVVGKSTAERAGSDSPIFDDNGQSRDLIYFYFYDLINEQYIPFRATITSLSDQNSADWEDIQYMGRADKLFVYKGFSRDVNFAFSVYANSAKEMIPMWNRINYLVGLTRPSKYTTSSGKQDRFIYPPMVTFRIGDMYVDQPCVISSVGVTVPDDTNWESYREGIDSATAQDAININREMISSIDSNFFEGGEYDEEMDSYLSQRSAVENDINNLNQAVAASTQILRQLPLKVDISVSMKLLEKRQSLGRDMHYGKSTSVKRKWEL